MLDAPVAANPTGGHVAALAAPVAPYLAATTSTPCVAALIRDVVLPASAQVDEIVVVLAPGSPPLGAAAIEVAAGHWERVMQVHGVTSQRLRFSPPLSSRTFQIALLPVFGARADACVSRIELRAAGRSIARVHP